MAQQQSSVRERVSIELDVPQMYNVWIHNDDFTTMEFVVEVLVSVFRRPVESATELMLRVHREGRAVAGTYSYDVARTKAMRATEMARQQDFPLELTVEPAD